MNFICSSELVRQLLTETDCLHIESKAVQSFALAFGANDWFECGWLITWDRAQSFRQHGQSNLVSVRKQTEGSSPLIKSIYLLRPRPTMSWASSIHFAACIPSIHFVFHMGTFQAYWGSGNSLDQVMTFFPVFLSLRVYSGVGICGPLPRISKSCSSSHLIWWILKK